MSKFKHPTTVQWYDRLREMWPAVSDLIPRFSWCIDRTRKYVVIHWAEFTKAEPSATATVANSSEKSSSPAIQINQAPRSSASVTFLTSTINTSVLTPATTIDDHAADSGSITDYESESGMEGYDLDADWRPDGYGIAEEVNTSSDWYQYHPPMGEASACGKKRLVQSTEMGATNDASAVEGENGGYSDWGAGGWGASYWDATEETVHSDCNDGYNDSWGVAEEGVPSGYKHDYNYNDDWGVADAGVHSNCHENYDYEWGVADDGANSDCNDAYNDDCGWGSGVSQADEW